MEKNDLVYLGHMLDMAESALGKVRGRARADYDQDENLRMALALLIQTIGEAGRHVSPQFRTGHPEIPWAQVIGMRHKIVHDYMHINFDIVWDVVSADLLPLVAQLRRLIPADEK